MFLKGSGVRFSALRSSLSGKAAVSGAPASGAACRGHFCTLLRSGAPEAEAEVELRGEVTCRELLPGDPRDGALAEAEEGCIFR